MISSVNTSLKERVAYDLANTNTRYPFMDIDETQCQIQSEREKINYQNADIQELYLLHNSSKTIIKDVAKQEATEVEEISENKKPKKTTYYQGVPMETWALSDPKYTDRETGISWYVRDGKYPYMIGEDAEKFRKLCSESGEFALKKFTEMTGLIQQIDENTVAYIGDNGIGIKSKDGKELFVDTTGMSYDSLMNMFNYLPKTDNYFDTNYWMNNMRTYSS